MLRLGLDIDFAYWFWVLSYLLFISNYYKVRKDTKIAQDLHNFTGSIPAGDFYYML